MSALPDDIILPAPTAEGVIKLQALYRQRFKKELREGEAQEILQHLTTIVWNSFLILDEVGHETQGNGSSPQTGGEQSEETSSESPHSDLSGKAASKRIASLRATMTGSARRAR